MPHDEASVRQLWSTLVTQSWNDEQLRKRLLEEPAAVLEEHGVAVPDGATLKTFEDDGSGRAGDLNWPFWWCSGLGRLRRCWPRGSHAVVDHPQARSVHALSTRNCSDASKRWSISTKRSGVASTGLLRCTAPTASRRRSTACVRATTWSPSVANSRRSGSTLPAPTAASTRL